MFRTPTKRKAPGKLLKFRQTGGLWSSPPAGIPTENLKLHLRHGTGISSSSWADQSGLGNDVTFYNGATPLLIGGTAGVDFDGVNDYAAVSNNLGITTKICTLFARANFSTNFLSGAILNTGNGYDGMAFGPGNTNNSNAGNNFIVNVNGVKFINPSVAIGTGIHTLAVTVSLPSYSSSTIKMYLDGSLIFTDYSYSYAPTTQTSIGGLPGTAFGQANPVYTFDGTILDALVYEAELTAEEILQIHNSL